MSWAAAELSGADGGEARLDKHQATSRFFNQALNEACPQEWRLLTHRKVNNLAEASEIVEWYRYRWPIEAFFKGYQAVFERLI